MSIDNESMYLQYIYLFLFLLFVLAGFLNLRGADIESTPVFFSYLILTQNDIYLYILDETRITHYIENHFYTEGIDVKVKEYNSTLAGINTVVCFEKDIT